MNCSVPPPLSDEQIEELLDGSTDPTLIDHIANCVSCAVRLKQAKTFETHLKARLYRWDCPTSDILADYDMNLLSESEHKRIAKHVETCPHCQSEIRDLRNFLNDDSLPEIQTRAVMQPRKSPMRSIAKISKQAPATALRGKTAGPIMAQTDSGIMLFLEIHSEATQTILVGQIVSEGEQNWEGALVKVFQVQQIQSIAKVGDMGDFRCKIADTSPIMLEISTENQQTIIVENLVFDE